MQHIALMCLCIMTVFLCPPSLMFIVSYLSNTVGLVQNYDCGLPLLSCFHLAFIFVNYVSNTFMFVSYIIALCLWIIRACTCHSNTNVGLCGFHSDYFKSLVFKKITNLSNIYSKFIDNIFDSKLLNILCPPWCISVWIVAVSNIQFRLNKYQSGWGLKNIYKNAIILLSCYHCQTLDHT